MGAYEPCGSGPIGRGKLEELEVVRESEESDRARPESNFGKICGAYERARSREKIAYGGTDRKFGTPPP